MTAGRRALALAALVAVATAAAGCGEASRVDRAAPVTVSGTAKAPDGSPLAGRAVRLGGGVGTDEAGLAALTLGLACTSGICSGKVHDTTTAADGTYRFDLKGADTQSAFGRAVTQLVSVSAAPAAGHVSGALASARFMVQTPDVRLPALELVDPGLAVDGSGGAVVARWSTTRPGPYEVTFEEAAAVPVWRAPAGAAPATVDPRLLEDSTGRVVVGGGSTDRIEGSDVQLRWRSPGVGYAAGAGPPPSRGAACRVVDQAGAAGPPLSGCPVTDGDLTSGAPLPVTCAAGQPCPGPAAVEVDLPAPLPAQLVVVRGCEGGCAVALSGDGSAYQPAGAVSNGFGTVALDGRPVTAVRVGLGTGQSLREVSVWAGPPGTAALRSAAAPAGLRRAFDAGAGDDDHVPVGLVVAAALLAAAVLVGAGYAAGRRR